MTYTNTPVPTIPSGSYPAWDRNTPYQGQTLVTHNGKVWKSKWWTLNEEPGIASVWELQSGNVSTNTPTPTPASNTNTPTSTKASTNTPTTAANTPTPTQSSNGYPAWSPNNVYYVANQSYVSYNGSNYLCTYTHNSNSAWTPDLANTLWRKI